ncbi:MAG: hypothetical protein JW818_14435 [Pirellulales bacterium]|nr:hypothetical protein [Pirellulales bacterium]
MHARELVELAALVAAHGPTLIQDEVVVSDSAIEEYWAASKCRLDRWAHRLHAMPTDGNEVATGWHETTWPAQRTVFEEIFTGELLARVITAVSSAYDRRRRTEQINPVARSILLAHLEARNRALYHLVRGSAIRAEEAFRLDRLRRRVERWIDMLVGLVADDEDFDELAIEPQRARDFGEDLHYRHRIRGAAQAWPLIQVSLRGAFQRTLSPESPNGDLNARIAAAVISCFPADLFDSTGVFRSLWMVRLTHGADDAKGMVDDLLTPSPPAMSAEPEGLDVMLNRLRRFGAC